MKARFGQGGPSGIACLTRRAALGTAVSLAAVTIPRKPRAQEAEPGGLQLRDPTPLPAAVQWVGGNGAVHRVADYAGTGLVLNFWATWCPPCIAELPALAALSRRVADDRILILPISTDAGGAAAVAPFYAAHNLAALGIWLDPHQAALDAVGATGLPTTLMVDRQGREVARVSGPVDWQAAASIVRALCDSG